MKTEIGKMVSMDIVLTKENFELIKSVYDGTECDSCFIDGDNMVVNIRNETHFGREEKVTKLAELYAELFPLSTEQKLEMCTAAVNRRSALNVEFKESPLDYLQRLLGYPDSEAYYSHLEHEIPFG